MNDYLSLAPEVAEAVAARQAVVALESTIIAHGMPYPRNVETARSLERIIRSVGAVPATIAVLDGRIRVGLDDADLERLATAETITKLSRRDLPGALAMGIDGATTVAATMICARMAGISVFATGGIGGVHRGAETTFDVSADLEELAMTDVAVVCAGAKAILDLPKTLEYLETRGVPVVGYGTDRFPAFYTPDSGLSVPLRADDPETVARILKTKWHLGLKGGVVIANPIPTPVALDPGQMDRAIDEALADAERTGLTGKDVTPFLLDRVATLTGGSSLAANVALVENNARLAAEIARALAALRSETTPNTRKPVAPRLR